MCRAHFAARSPWRDGFRLVAPSTGSVRRGPIRCRFSGSVPTRRPSFVGGGVSISRRGTLFVMVVQGREPVCCHPGRAEHEKKKKKKKKTRWSLGCRPGPVSPKGRGSGWRPVCRRALAQGRAAGTGPGPRRRTSSRLVARGSASRRGPRPPAVHPRFCPGSSRGRWGPHCFASPLPYGSPPPRRRCHWPHAPPSSRCTVGRRNVHTGGMTSGLSATVAISGYFVGAEPPDEVGDQRVVGVR